MFNAAFDGGTPYSRSVIKEVVQFRTSDDLVNNTVILASASTGSVSIFLPDLSIG